MPSYQSSWHHALMTRALDRVVYGQCRRVMIFAPPRHTKSELTSRRLPAFLFGRRPGIRVIATSHTFALAAELAGDVSGIMESDSYRELFPGAALPPRKRGGGAGGLKRTAEEFHAPQGGRYVCAGVDGPITGRGFDIGIIDDPIKNAMEAQSKVKRESVKRWYATTFATRQQPDAGIVITLTRWHPDDLAGWLLTLAESDPQADQWEVYILPAISGDVRPAYDARPGPGLALWPDWFGLDRLLSQRAGMTAHDWAALYQQTPTVEGGNHFKSHWFSRFRDAGDHWHLGGDKYAHRPDCTVYVCVDPAASEKESADYTAIGVFAATPANDLLVLDVVRERLGVDRIVPRLADVCRQYAPAFISFEANGFQLALAHAARRMPGMPPVRETEHYGRGKLVRATPAIIKAQSGQIYLPDGAAWVRDYIQELVEFTGVDDAHDDQVDVTADAVSQLPRMLADGPEQPPAANEHRYWRPERESHAAARGLWGRR